MLPPETFGAAAPDLSFVCADRRAFQGATALEAEIVKAAGGASTVTVAMDEWSRLGWYQLAAYALMRGHCCPDAQGLKVPEAMAPCKLEAALCWLPNALGDPGELVKALASFGRAASCLSQTGLAEQLGQQGPPSGGETAYLERLLARIRRDRAR
jgi:hypothetical protein